MEESESMKNYYTKKISNLNKDINYFKSKDVNDKNTINQLKEQRNNIISSNNPPNNIIIPSKLSSIEDNIIISKSNQKEEITTNITIYDLEELEKLKKIYQKCQINEKKWEMKYRQLREKFKILCNLFHEQNQTHNQEITNNNNQNEIEFGIDKSNPFYTEDDDNKPEVNLKFNSNQYNQFTYILFKNFESKGIISNESVNKIINPFIEFANKKNIKIVKYPSSKFDIIIEEYTKIILGVLNMDNKYNHILTKIFLSALLINSECDIQKMIEYIAILFSYTRDYKTDEEKYLKKLMSSYTKELIEINNCINNYIENNNEDNDDHNKKYPLIKLKELIEENQINLKDKYVEFLFYYLRKFDDKESKLEDLKYTLLNDILEQLDDQKENKKLNTEPNKRNGFVDMLKNNSRDNYIDNENSEELKKDESNQEITIAEYQKYINSSLNSIKTALDKKNISFKDFIEEKKQNMNYEGEDIEYISINDLNDKLKSIGINLSDINLSCLYNKYGIGNDLGLINIKKLEDDINSFEI